MKKQTKIGLQILIIFIVGLVTGWMVTRFSGGTLIGQPAAPKPAPKTTDGSEYNRRQPVSIDLVRVFPKLITRQGDPHLKVLALTFDDGPDYNYTPRILDILKANNVKATFFVVGTQIEKCPATFKRMIKEGHEIGSHGYQHIKICELPVAKIKAQLDRNNALIKANGGASRLIYRPTYGAIDPASVQTIARQGYQIILWTIDSLDWRGLKKQQVMSNVIPKLKEGYIILQHCAAESKKEDLTGSIEALREIIRTAKKQGYRFITISELLREIKK
jgi:peptidoglycan-N-acetylglucosamine deacetylase